ASRASYYPRGGAARAGETAMAAPWSPLSSSSLAREQRVCTLRRIAVDHEHRKSRRRWLHVRRLVDGTPDGGQVLLRASVLRSSKAAVSTSRSAVGGGSLLFIRAKVRDSASTLPAMAYAAAGRRSSDRGAGLRYGWRRTGSRRPP